MTSDQGHRFPIPALYIVHCYIIDPLIVDHTMGVAISEALLVLAAVSLQFLSTFSTDISSYKRLSMEDSGLPKATYWVHSCEEI